MIEQLRQRIHGLTPIDYWAGTHEGPEAAVLLALTTEADPHIILTKRAEHLKNHRGEVALPGGMIDPEDDSLVATALRESMEEIALEPCCVEVLGHLDSMVTRFGVKVTPVLGLISPDLELVANPDELDSVFRVPLSFFIKDERLRTDCGTVNGHAVAVPCWNWQGYHIWGVTAIILVNFMNRVLGLSIDTGIEKLALLTGGRITPQDWVRTDTTATD
jgi:8-oxo-dGTP pyrophosphatase MutT (NUDIX family)